MAWKESFSNIGLLVLRVGFGAQMAALHGMDKLRQFSERAGSYPDPLSIGHRNSLILTVVAELVCALLLVLGLASRMAALTLTFVMGVGLFMQQANVPWHKKEMALLYFGAFLTIFLLGPGRLSLDAAVVPRMFKRSGSSSGRMPARLASASR